MLPEPGIGRAGFVAAGTGGGATLGAGASHVLEEEPPVDRDPLD